MFTPTYGVSKTTSGNQRDSIGWQRFPWWAGAIFYVGITALGRIVSGNPKKTKGLYEKKLKQAPWAPPGWVFGPVWAINNIFITRALRKLTNERYKGKRDKQLIALQMLIWTIFGTFGYVYFRKKSLLLAAIWTQADAVAALASLIIAWKKDKRFAANYIPLTAWTWFASSVGWYQAIANRDTALNTPALKELV